MWTSNQKRIWLSLGIILIIGFIGGIFFITFVAKNEQNVLINSFTNFWHNIDSLKINYLTNHFLIMPVLIISSFLILGLVLIPLYLLYIGFLMGIVISNFIIIGGFKGFIFGLIYIIITRLAFLFLFSIMAVALIKITILLINLIFKKNSDNKNKIFFQLKKCLICFILIMINDTILYFLGDNLVKIFKFLII